MQAQVEMNSGEKYSFGGFMAISREKLKELPGDKLAELAKTDELELIYLQLQSMRNFGALKHRLGVARTEEVVPTSESNEPSLANQNDADVSEKKSRGQAPKTSKGSRARSAVLE